MELIDTFTVARSVDDTWALLTDPVRVAPCIPGAHLTEIDGADHHGVVNVRLGVLQARFTGVAHFEVDPDRNRIIVRATGDGNQGPAEAHITARLEPLSDEQTQVNVDTDLQLSGRLAHLGRGVIIEVSSALTAEFAANLAASTAAEGVLGPDAFVAVRTGVAMPEPDALDLLDAARRPIAKRLVPLAGVVVAVAGAVRKRRRRHR
ncbi:MAG: SRPBCC family protein [Actinomycetota bacterium]